MVFLSPEIDCFLGNRQQSNASAERKKHMFFLVMRGLNLMRRSSKREKKHSVLTFVWEPP